MKRLNSSTVFWLYILTLGTSAGWLIIPDVPNEYAFWIQWVLSLVLFAISAYLAQLEHKTKVAEIMESIKNSK